jgi:hypothetical protein
VPKLLIASLGTVLDLRRVALDRIHFVHDDCAHTCDFNPVNHVTCPFLGANDDGHWVDEMVRKTARRSVALCSINIDVMHGVHELRPHVQIFIVSKRLSEQRSSHMPGRSARGCVVKGHVARSV